MSTINLYYPMLTPIELKSLIAEVNNNIDESYIEYNIELSQKKIMRPLLGYSLYNQILLEISGGTISGNTADYIIYNDYLKLILALATYQRLVTSMSYQLENNGLRIKVSETSDVSQVKDQVFIRNNIQNDIDFFKSELIDYLCENRASYPLYFNDTDARNDHMQKRTYGNTWTIGSVNSNTRYRNNPFR